MTEPTATILVIDDEQGIREGCRRALAGENLEVDLAENGEVGLRKLAERPYDLVLLDIMMPGVGGLQVLAEALARDPEMIVTIITGYATVELAIQAIKAGAYDFLSKPFDAATLIHAVNQGLERRRLSLEAQRLRAHEVEAERLRQEKAELQRINQLKSRFTLLVAHELRAPVAAIQSYLKLILEGYVDPSQFPDIVRKAERRAGEQLALISDLLELARITGGPTQADEMCSLDVVEALEETVDLMRGQAEEKGLGLQIEVGPDIPLIAANPKHIRQLWNNLLSNAIKYTPTGGQVTVQVACDGAAIVGSVQDTGIGIPPEDQAHLFEDFFRARNAKEFERMGTGLGLSIVKAILDLYSGQIEVASEVGKGTTFTFSLPTSCFLPPA